MSNYHVTGDYWGAPARVFSALPPRAWLQPPHRYDARRGQYLTLTIDARLNNKIYELLDTEHNAAVLVCNYKTGELLGMVSAPTVDPLDLENGVLTGRISTAASPPLSPPARPLLVTAAAAIENIPDINERTFYCEGEYKIGRTHYLQGRALYPDL